MDAPSEKSARGHLAWRVLERFLLSRRPTVSVLIFHRVLRDRDPLRPNEPVVEEFEALVKFLAGNFRVRLLREAVAEVVSGDSAGHSVAITFDDGYADNVDNAMPVLTKYGVPATFFITSGTLDSGIMWNDRLLHAIRETPNQHIDLGRFGLGRLRLNRDESRVAAFKHLIQNLKYRDSTERNELVAAVEEAAAAAPPPRLMMTRRQVQELGCEPLADVGGHTVSHPILARLPDREAEREIVSGKEALEELIERKVRCFAYPNGLPDSDYSARHVDMVRAAGFELAVSTSVGGFGPDADIFQIPRIKPWDRRTLTFGLRMLVASRRDGLRTVGADRSIRVEANAS